jgi:hypothetical protein
MAVKVFFLYTQIEAKFKNGRGTLSVRQQMVHIRNLDPGLRGNGGSFFVSLSGCSFHIIY